MAFRGGRLKAHGPHGERPDRSLMPSQFHAISPKALVQQGRPPWPSNIQYIQYKKAVKIWRVSNKGRLIVETVDSAGFLPRDNFRRGPSGGR
jgi:hypothetical protein